MAYLILKSSKLNTIKSKSDDLVVLGQVIDSQCSYEIPKKITTISDLTKWFGSEYSEYQYHCELLNSGATLLLYKPISLEKRDDTEFYVDYSGFFVDETVIYDDPEEIPTPEDRTVYQITDTNGFTRLVIYDGEKFEYADSGIETDVLEEYSEYSVDNTIYHNISEIFLPSKKRRETLFQVTSEEKDELSKYIWVDEIQEYVDINMLPQNTSTYDKSISWNNRDTLSLGRPDPDNKITISHPRFSDNDIPENIKENSDKSRIQLLYNESKVENKEISSYAFSLDFTDVVFDEKSYICLTAGPSSTRVLLYFECTDTSNLPKIDYVLKDNRHLISGKTKDEIVQGIWNFIESYEIKSERIFWRSGNSFWSNYAMPVDYFYKVQGLIFEPDYRLSWDVVNQGYSDNRISFISKTIGKHKDNITVKIEKSPEGGGEYQVTISRGGVGEEVHVGNIFPNINEDPSYSEEFLEYVINRDSDLVRVKINQYYTDYDTGKTKRWSLLEPSYTVSSPVSTDEIVYCTSDSQYYQNGKILPNSDLPCGTWELKGSETESVYSPEEYQEALNCFIESEIPMDFLMVPRMSDYRTETDLSSVSWYPEYEVILDFCKTNNTQALISNNDIGETITSFPETPKSSWIYRKIEDLLCLYRNEVWYKINQDILSEKPSNPEIETIYQIEQSRSWEWTDSGWIEKTSDKKYTSKKYSRFPEDPRKKIEYIITKTWFWEWTGSEWSELVDFRDIYSIEDSFIYKEQDCLPDSPSTNAIYHISEAYYTYNSGKWYLQNSRESCNPYLNEFIWNYIQTTDTIQNPKDLDPHNYLVYFYRKIWSHKYSSWRPGYYNFLRMIIQDDHTLKDTEIYYDSPVEDPLDFETEVPLETLLEHKKSNYLVTDSLGYYYKKYLNHTGDNQYKTSILTRFFQSNLSRRFDYNKWSLLNSLTEARMVEKVNSILSNFSTKYSLVGYASLDDYTIDRSTSTASFWITLRTKELVDKNINLYITLNYTT